jgi:2-(1,2-epoxy-1,2-dihydrophenyl)acetyl-CoA isomerase
VNRVLSADELEAEVQALAEQLASGPTLAYGHLKRLLRTSFERSMTGQLDEEAAAYADCARSADFLEGVAAFIGKRQAQFKGR